MYGGALKGVQGLAAAGAMVLFTVATAGVAFAQAPSGEAPAAPSLAPTIATGILPRDLSPWGMFLNADIVVKAVMIGLVFASIVTWTVWLAKNYELWSAKKKARAALGVLARARSLAEVERAVRRSRAIRWPGSSTPPRLEVQLSANASAEGLKERVVLAARADRDRGRPADRARHGRARQHRRDRAVRRPVRHGLGHHEQLHRHFERAHHQSRGGRAGHRGSAARDRARPVRRHSRRS